MKFYNSKNQEMRYRERDEIGDWFPNEKYAIGEDGVKIKNPNYTKAKADRWELDLAKQNAMNSNSPDDMKLLIDPKSALYDYAYARQHADDGYLPLEDQLDNLFHDIDKGLISVKAKQSSFYIHRKEVKEQRYPKK